MSTPLLAVLFETDKIQFYTQDLNLHGELMGTFHGLCVLPNGTVAAVTAPDTITIIDSETATTISTATSAETFTSGGRHNWVAAHPSGDLLVGRTASVIRVKTDGTLVSTYGFGAVDFAINPAGTKVVYVNPSNQAQLLLWDLSGDTDLGLWRDLTDVFTTPVVNYVCRLCSGDVVANVVNSEATSGQIYRLKQTGDPTLLYPNPDSPSDFDEWPIGLATDGVTLFAFGDWDESPVCPTDDANFLRSYNLRTASTLTTKVFCYDDISDQVGMAAILNSPPVVTVTGLRLMTEIDCLHVEITGTGFVGDLFIELQGPNGVHMPFTIVSQTDTRIVLLLTTFVDGQYCVTVGCV